MGIVATNELRANIRVVMKFARWCFICGFGIMIDDAIAAIYSGFGLTLYIIYMES